MKWQEEVAARKAEIERLRDIARDIADTAYRNDPNKSLRDYEFGRLIHAEQRQRWERVSDDTMREWRSDALSTLDAEIKSLGHRICDCGVGTDNVVAQYCLLAIRYAYDALYGESCTGDDLGYVAYRTSIARRAMDFAHRVAMPVGACDYV